MRFFYKNNLHHGIEHLLRAPLPTLFLLFCSLNICPNTDFFKGIFLKKEKAQQFLQMVMSSGRHAGEGGVPTGCVIVVFPQFTLKRKNIPLPLLFCCHREVSQQY